LFVIDTIFFLEKKKKKETRGATRKKISPQLNNYKGN